MAEGQYNLTQALGLKDKGTDVLVGGNWKQYVLNSQGTLFADTAGRIKINEVGVYAQVSQKFFHDVLKLTASGRYDKNDNFAGHFTPRFSAVITVAKDQNIRISYQTAYRFPTTQNQWINLTVGSNVKLIGGLPALRDFYHFGPNDNSNPVYTQQSFQAFAATGDPTKLSLQTFGEYKPESSNSFEVGYKGLFAKKFLIDVYGYFAVYNNFLSRETVIQSPDGTIAGFAKGYNVFSLSVNSPTNINTTGFGASIEYLLRNNYNITANAYTDDITNVPTGLKAYWNTPKYRANIGFGNSGFLYNNRVGFNVIWRWQDTYFNESDFLQGDVSAFSTIDAQISYKLPKIKSVVKLGATNILNAYYVNAYGNPYIGGLYYISFGYNVF
jgi:outer membrane receptor protein involved in Fe transport